MCEYVFSNPTTSQEGLDLIKYYCASQDRTGNFAVINGPTNHSSSHYTPNAGQHCPLESLRDHDDDQVYFDVCGPG